jgi:cytochrome oxidase Cu insertion factor (SCO1/SenC/PrrC family)
MIVTLDPWRDTPGALPSLAARWELPPGGRVLSGTVAQVNAALDGFGVPRRRDLATGDIAHPPLVYVVDPAGTIAYALSNPSPRWIVAAGARAAAQATAAGR